MTDLDLARRLDQLDRLLSDLTGPSRPGVPRPLQCEFMGKSTGTAAISSKPHYRLNAPEPDVASERGPTTIPVSTEQLLAAVPTLRLLARSLCGSAPGADDLVQETLIKAWGKIESFEHGANLIAWLYAILRNEVMLQVRRHDGQYQDNVFVARSAIATLDFRAALGRLSSDYREALMLVGAAGLSNEEAAVICRCAVGTMTGRVARAMASLAEMLASVTSTVQGDVRLAV